MGRGPKPAQKFLVRPSQEARSGSYFGWNARHLHNELPNRISYKAQRVHVSLSLYPSFKPDYIHRFHSVRPLKESYNTETVIMLLTLSVHPEGAKLYDQFSQLQDRASTQLIGQNHTRTQQVEQAGHGAKKGTAATLNHYFQRVSLSGRMAHRDVNQKPKSLLAGWRETKQKLIPTRFGANRPHMGRRS